MCIDDDGPRCGYNIKDTGVGEWGRGDIFMYIFKLKQCCGEDLSDDVERFAGPSNKSRMLCRSVATLKAGWIFRIELHSKHN